jgi:cytochrome c oxidase subunit 2
VPGLDIPVWFIPNRTGQYEIACSQLCGLGHFRMRGFMTIQTDEEFRNFLVEEAKLATQ